VSDTTHSSEGFLLFLALKHSAVWRLLLVCVLLVAPCRSSQAQARPPTINVRDHGVRGFKAGAQVGPVVGPAIEALMKDYPDGTLYFPAGDYLLVNETLRQDGLVIGPGFHGMLVFASGASLVCNTATQTAGTCVHFVSASHVSSQNLTIRYLGQQGLPRERAAAVSYALLIEDSSNLELSATRIEASPGACFWATNSSGLKVHDLHVTRCTADGVHFENDRMIDLQDMWSLQTQDDGLAFTSVAADNPGCGAVANGIHIKNSYSRGIAVPGGCDIAVSNFEIDRTGVSGILVNTDNAFHMRRPQNISFRDGVVSHAGVLASSSGGGNKFGIEISAADNVSVAHVQIESAAGRGFDVAHGATHITLTGSSISRSGDNAINIIGSSDILMASDSIKGAAGYGIYLAEVRDFKGSDLTIADVSTRLSATNLHRTFWVDNPAGSTRLEGLKVIDDQAAATGYILGCANIGKQTFSITGLSSSMRQGRLQVECAGEVRRSAF
jgi:hypothetical protein